MLADELRVLRASSRATRMAELEAEVERLKRQLAAQNQNQYLSQDQAGGGSRELAVGAPLTSGDSLQLADSLLRRHAELLRSSAGLGVAVQATLRGEPLPSPLLAAAVPLPAVVAAPPPASAAAPLPVPASADAMEDAAMGAALAALPPELRALRAQVLVPCHTLLSESAA